MSKLYEVLAPAGSVEQLVYAVNNGCDSVYLGLDSFNARMKAPNFTTENLRQWVDYCHLFGVKVFVAVNTSIKNDEFQKAWKTILTAYNNNADGIIVTDLALMKLAGKLPGQFDIVASTQLNVHDKYGAQFVKEHGATTVVCARECTLQDIADIASVGIKVEAFLHGALCVCQSGQCLFSSIAGGNSGNRGLCAQPCRKYYSSNIGKNGYLLSTKDFCGAKVIDDMVKAGVSVFKIEGRNRRAEYAGLTSKIYSQLINENEMYCEQNDIDLKTMYNRGNYTYNSYLHGSNSEIVYPYQQNHIGVIAGKITTDGFFTKVPLTQGDGLKVFKDKTEYCGGIVRESGVGLLQADFSKKVTPGMTVAITTSNALNESVSNRKRTHNVSLHLSAFAGKHAIITAKCGNISATIQSEYIVQKSNNLPLNNQQITQQLQKNSNNCYTITHITADFDDIFLAKSQLNSLRREVLEALTSQILLEYNLKFSERNPCAITIPTINSISCSNCVASTFYDKKQLESECNQVDIAIYKPEILDEKAFAKIKGYYYVDLPPFCNLDFLTQFNLSNNGIVCNNVGQVQYAKEKGIKYIAGSGLNIFNDYIASIFDDSSAFVYSYELSLKEIYSFNNKTGLIFVDGQLPLMKFIHCPYKSTIGCNCDNCASNSELTYTDELGNNFVIKRRKDKNCSFELLNGNKLSIVNKLTKPGRYLVDYNFDIVAHYKKLNDGLHDNFVEMRPYTKGRLYNKIN